MRISLNYEDQQPPDEEMKDSSEQMDPCLALLHAVSSASATKEYKELVDLIKSTFSSVDIVTACFHPKQPASNSEVAGVDFHVLENFYVSALNLEAEEVNSSMIEATGLLVSSLARSLGDGSWPSNSLQAVIVMLENRIFMEPCSYAVLSMLWRLILDSPESFRRSLSSALKLYSFNQLERLVTVIQHFITIQLYETPHISQEIISGVEVLQLIYLVNEVSQQIGYECFYNDAVNVEEFDIKTDFLRWVAPDPSAMFSFCRYPFVYDPSKKSAILQMYSAFQMSNNFEDAILMSIFVGATHPYLFLDVRRDFLVQDTIQEIQLKTDDLKKPLKVKFIGEAGVDEGGVQSEFFQLLARELFNPQYGMFSYNDEARCFWFNSTPVELNLDVEFELVGILLGLAIYNGHILDLHFPTVVYKKLLGKPLTLEDLGQVNPDLAKGLEQLLAFTGNVEEVYSRPFQVSEQDVFGRIVTIDLKEGGENISLTEENREEFVKLCVEHYLEKSIARQFKFFHRGFRRVCDSHVLNLFQPSELELLICGSPGLDFDALEKVTLYESYTQDSRVIRDFWEVVHSFDEEKKRKLLFFTTGSDRAPIKGLSDMHFLISRNGSDTERLPTAHTCFNTLLLPEYSSKEKLKELLTTAISNAEGFGLL